MTRGAAPALSARIITWQRRHGRHDLPWQNTRDPYRLWLSEIMLQQTQVATVIGYYTRFVQRFPDVAALAAAPLDDVLAAWSGLGYYSRARNLHRCAQAVVCEHGGRFPASAAALATLPGIGRSTAAAIAVFAFDERAAILDGNVKRVLTRALGFADDLSLTSNQKALWSAAEALLPERGIVAYTQGLMDLGATLCSRRRPECAACPLATICVAHALGRHEAYPVKTRKLQRGRRAASLLWLEHRGRVWLVQRPPRGVWAGLYSLPEFAADAEIEQCVADWPGAGEALAAFNHALTHFDWQLKAWRWCLPAALPAAQRKAIEASLPFGRWVGRGEALSLGLPAPIRRLLSQPD